MMRRAVAGVMSGVGIVAIAALTSENACLGPLPEPLACPREAVFPYCKPGGDLFPPPPDAGPSPCLLPSSECLGKQRAQCECTAAQRCDNAGPSCTPPPDCPESVRKAASGPKCLAVTSPEIRGTPSCVCGCASCAAVCDGMGPVLSANQVLVFHLSAPHAPSSLRAMVRARGTGFLSLFVQLEDGTSTALGEFDSRGETFTELFAIPTGADSV